MATHNDITNDKMISRHLSDKGRDNYDRIFGKKKPDTDCPLCNGDGYYEHYSHDLTGTATRRFECGCVTGHPVYKPNE